MKTLKTISSAFAVALLVSTVSAPAMETVTNLLSSAKDKVVSGATIVANRSVKAVKATDKFVFGNRLDLSGLPGFRRFKASSPLTRTAVALAPVVAVVGLGYAAYNHFFSAEEATEEVVGEVVEKDVPFVQEEVVVSTPQEEETVVSAPKAESKPARKPKIGARRMAKSPKARAAANRTAKRNAGGCANGKCGVRRSK